MRTQALLFCAALAAAGCVKRVAPSAGEDRTTLSGVQSTFGNEGDVPEGTEITWDFGDGTEKAKGGRVEHSFPRSGTFTVTQTVKDKDGEQRTSQAKVTVLRRSVPSALPADVRAALVMQSPWSRLQVHRQVAQQLALGSFFDEVARSVSAALGFDALDPQAAADNGFDTDEGIAFYTLPQDPEASVFVVGTSDDAKARASTTRLLSQKNVGRLQGGPFQLVEKKLPDGTPILVGQGSAGDRVGVLQRFGYLYLRLPGATDPALALQSAASLPPDKGLALDPKYLALSRHVGTGDAVFFSRGSDKGRLSEEVAASAFALTDRADLLHVRLFAELKKLPGPQLQAAFKPAKPPPDLATNLPAGAAAYLKISAAPRALWTELSRAAGPDAIRVRARLQESTGIDIEKDLIPSFTGNIGVGVYLDAVSLFEAVMGEQVGSFDKSAFVVAAELEKADTVQAALDRAMTSRPTSDRRSVRGAIWWRLGDAAQAALRGNFLFLAIGGQPPEEVAKPKPGRRRKQPPAPAEPTAAQLGVLGSVLLPQGETLSQELKRERLAGFDSPGVQNLWVDVAGIVRSIEKAGTEEGAQASAAARLFADRASGLRDALLQLHASPEGLDSDLYVRFPQKAKR